MVADVEVELHPRRCERAAERRREARRDPQVVPHVLDAQHHALLGGDRHQLLERLVGVARGGVLRRNVGGIGRIVALGNTIDEQGLPIERDLELVGIGHGHPLHAARHDQHHGRAVGGREAKRLLGGSKGGGAHGGIVRIEIKPRAHEGMDLDAMRVRQLSRRARLGDGCRLVGQLHAGEAGGRQAGTDLFGETLFDERLLEDGAERARPRRVAGVERCGRTRRGGGQGRKLEEVSSVHSR